ncbi:hypothetical protein IE077_001656 [Cardiosporidium cionae]|uniref:RNA polymerase II-associated protein 3 n=1 Tax=Cardiosporidium cionae TaxID=476202 RepID=A0ABQ7JCN1_9APIC|nr:hypothetical protein IE077_001656 [Cardiosporidium cionae]|eukprot:KAF8821739.1 hypothetical protein IE077_001656 [Cardiosporidium cionae]
MDLRAWEKTIKTQQKNPARQGNCAANEIAFNTTCREKINDSIHSIEGSAKGKADKYGKLEGTVEYNINERLRGDSNTFLEDKTIHGTTGIWRLKKKLLLNRGACHIKLLNYASAIQDCTNVLKLDRVCQKALFRRGVACAGISQWNEALSDFLTFARQGGDDLLIRQAITNATEGPSNAVQIYREFTKLKLTDPSRVPTLPQRSLKINIVKHEKQDIRNRLTLINQRGNDFPHCSESNFIEGVSEPEVSCASVPTGSSTIDDTDSLQRSSEGPEGKAFVRQQKYVSNAAIPSESTNSYKKGETNISDPILFFRCQNYFSFSNLWFSRQFQLDKNKQIELLIAIGTENIPGLFRESFEGDWIVEFVQLFDFCLTTQMSNKQLHHHFQSSHALVSFILQAMFQLTKCRRFKFCISSINNDEQVLLCSLFTRIPTIFAYHEHTELRLLFEKVSGEFNCFLQ